MHSGLVDVSSTEWKKIRIQKWTDKNRSKINLQKRNRNRKKRYEIIDSYGGQCVNCKESNHDILDLDHINNDGNQEQGGNTRIIPRFLKEGINKEKYQLLYKNCNWLKHLYNTELKALEKGGIPPF